MQQFCGLQVVSLLGIAKQQFSRWFSRKRRFLAILKLNEAEDFADDPKGGGANKSKFTGEQVAFALAQAEVGTPVAEVCRKMGVSEATYYRGKQLYGVMGPSELRKMRQLEEENKNLKRLVADLSIGVAMQTEMTAQLVTDALVVAIWRRGKPDALHHSDQGSQYTSEQFQRLMANSGVNRSMSRSGDCWDNAAMESFFSSIKTERIGRKVYRARDEARADVFDYIERFYNPTRRHSTIGYKSPIDFEREAGVA